MKKIPQKLREDMSNDPYMKKCCFPFIHDCQGKIEWHHALIFGGSQVQEKECILPICQAIHEKARNTDVKEILDLVMYSRMSPEQMKKYSKAINIFHRFNYLANKYDYRLGKN